VRVLAAMTVARELDAVYVWGAQTGGARKLGVPEATVTAIRENHSRGIPPADAEIVEFTRQLLRKHRVDDAKDLEATYGIPGGHPSHGEPSLDQLFVARPLLGWGRYRTPVGGLYLCGAGTHPGGGVTGGPGANAAREIVKDLR
jgi:phytoene dehydrogenase-like protein